MSSCSSLSLPWMGKDEEAHLPKSWRELELADYTRHYSSFEMTYLSSADTRAVKLDTAAEEYVRNLTTHIIQNNELFFEKREQPRIHVIRHGVPFHFSLPNRSIFLSSGLINRYIKHEAILAAILSFELIRAEKDLYNKLTIVPVGYLSVERILGLTRLNLDEKMEIHKWAYHFMRRSGFDGEYYLSWLQTMNRNASDFMPLVGDAASISLEEALFKAFMVRRSKNEDERTLTQRESTKNFYRFLFYVKDQDA